MHRPQWKARPPVCRARPLLGTFVEVAVEGLDRGRADAAIDRAFGEIAAVQRRMSFHDPDSELSRLNRALGPCRVRISRELGEVLAFARRLSRLSGGIFDVTLGEALKRHGYLPGVASPEREGARWSDWRLLDGGILELDRPLALDLGGIAKGYAVDRAVDALRAIGAPAGRVNAGGDLRLFGSDPCPIRLRHPRNPSRSLELGSFREISVATSAGSFLEEASGVGGPRLPILDPRTGLPIRSRRSVSVLAKRCMAADALTKVLHLAPELGLAIGRSFDARAVFLEAARGWHG